MGLINIAHGTRVGHTSTGENVEATRLKTPRTLCRATRRDRQNGNKVRKYTSIYKAGTRGTQKQATAVCGVSMVAPEVKK